VNRPRRRYTPAERRELDRATQHFAAHVRRRTGTAVAKRYGASAVINRAPATPPTTDYPARP
jgi:hypothetical protein